jgi:hypothetical protein
MMLHCNQNILPSSCLFLELTIASYSVVCLFVCVCVCVCVHPTEVHKFDYSDVNQLVKYIINKLYQH